MSMGKWSGARSNGYGQLTRALHEPRIIPNILLHRTLQATFAILETTVFQRRLSAITRLVMMHLMVPWTKMI